MSAIGGTLGGVAIPVMRHGRERGETTAAMMTRIGAATGFAYAMDPRQFVGQPGFEFETTSLTLANGTLARGKIAGVVRMVRDADLVAATGVDALFIYAMLSGSLTARLGARQVTVVPGDLFVHDLAYPAEIVMRGYEVLTLIIDRAVLAPDLRSRMLHGTHVQGTQPLSRIVSGMLRSLHDGGGELGAEDARTVLDHALALLGRALTARTIAARIPVSIGAAAESAIEAGLDDPELSPARIAAEIGVSRATLYRALHATGGVRRLIADRRLHRAWSLATSGESTLAEISRRCGFSTAQRLQQAFKRRFCIELSALHGASSVERDALLGSMRTIVEANWRRVTHNG